MKISNKIALSVTFIACFLLIVIGATVKGGTLPVSAGVNGKQVIVIDAGHGGADSGCVGVNGCYEKDINLAIVKNLQSLLTISGFEVVLTRSEDVSIHDENVEGLRDQKVSDMENRLEIVNTYPDCIFVSVHQNQFTEKQYFGGQIFYTTNNPDNFKFAQIMQNCFRELQPENDREIKLIDNGLYLFKTTQQPALLIECGFLSNESDAANLTDSEYQKKTAFVIYKGLMEYIKTVALKPGNSITATSMQ